MTQELNKEGLEKAYRAVIDDGCGWPHHVMERVVRVGVQAYLNTAKVTGFEEQVAELQGKLDAAEKYIDIVRMNTPIETVRNQRDAARSRELVLGKENTALKAQLAEAASNFKEEAEFAYMSYVQKLKSPECLGWEEKVRKNMFGIVEMKAHAAANVLLGQHEAFSTCSAKLQAALAGGSHES